MIVLATKAVFWLLLEIFSLVWMLPAFTRMLFSWKPNLSVVWRFHQSVFLGWTFKRRALIKGKRNWWVRAGISRELAGRKWSPSRVWQVVKNTKQLKVRFYFAELHANSLVVMNTALLRPCHVFVQLSYILATCTRCLLPSSSRHGADTLHEAVPEASTD